MNHLSDRGEQAVSLLTKLAYGDLALVRDALSQHGNGRVEDLIAYIRDRRTASPQSPPEKKAGTAR